MSIGGYLAFQIFAFYEQAQQVTGEVIQISESVSHKGSYTYSPIVSFQTLDQQKIIFQPRTSSSSLGFEVGDIVNVSYLPSNPKEAKIDEWRFVWFLPATFIGLGGVFFLIGLLVAYLDRPQKSKSSKKRSR